MIRIKFINILKNQPKYNNGIENTKINIHLPVFDWIYNVSIDINNKIKKVTKSEIDFSPITFQIPHISLAMGFIKSENDYMELCNKLDDFITNFQPIDLTFSNPYIKKPGNKYVFIDINEKEKIINLKQEINEIIKEHIESVKWDIINEPPHITVGYITDNQKKVEKILNINIPKKTLTINKINLSFSGKRGSCIGILREFNKNNC